MREPKPGLWEGGQGKGRAVTEVSAAPRRSDGEEDLGLEGKVRSKILGVQGALSLNGRRGPLC